jgi:hypothetical protein
MTRWSVRGAPGEKGIITTIIHTTRLIENNSQINKLLVIGYMAGAVHRDFKGSVVMLSTNHTHLIVPKHRTWRESVQTPIELTILNPLIDSAEDSDFMDLASQDSGSEKSMCGDSSDESNSSSLSSRICVTRSRISTVSIPSPLNYIDFTL